ncbi:MAG TPA: phosphoglucomutase (alpha-D-glucose-1,6-bisphosphate-dependent) [Burkholderiales bacterium]|nr:phosphoglucomutase (alpha-D-glucose-1,6-bisphosphate-dependent) [Burkholderiales bacterium]
MSIDPRAGRPAPADVLTDIPRLVSAYYTEVPDPAVPAQRVAFGTSGHRGSSFAAGFNEWHVLAITEAICRHRRQQGIDGPLVLGIDTHALSTPAAASAIEVLAAHGVELMLARDDGYTPTPAVSHAILSWNRGRDSGKADGIVVTPSHNPPDSGGFKYNPPNGGPADTDVTKGIEAAANELLAAKLAGVRRMPLAAALRAPTTHRHDYLDAYVSDLGAVLDMDAIRGARLRLGADALGGAGLRYWERIADTYGLDITVFHDQADPTFRFMTLDWDGRIRMDPSSTHAMQGLLRMKDGFDIAFACDTDHDRHGIVTRSAGLMPPNHYLAVCIDHLFRHRPQWRGDAGVGKTAVSSQMIDRLSARLGRRLHEVPVGFKWFVDGLSDGTLGFAGEESAGASFLRKEGSPWTTDKDGIVPGLLSAEIIARSGRDPGEVYARLEQELGRSCFDRIDAPASAGQKERLSKLGPERIRSKVLAGDPIRQVFSRAPGNGAPIGGVKVVSDHGWFAARPSGTEDIYKIYAESFRGDDHLKRIIAEAQAIVGEAIASEGA